MNSFAGTTMLLKAALRRDRVMVTVTLALLAILVGFSDRATRNLYPPGGVPAGLSATMRSTAFVALYGPLPQPASIDAIGVSKVLLLPGLGLAVLAQVIVRRHTRADEESGLAELISAQVVGRRAALTAALLLALGVTLTSSALTAAALCVVGAPVSGSVAFGLGWVVLGTVGAGIAAVGVQVAGSTRGAGQLGLSALGVLYLFRMVGDTSASGLSWATPIGWVSKSAPFGGNRYWIVLPGIALCALLVLAAYRLLDRRDLGLGLLPQRIGRARGRIAGITGLVWRLLRATLVGWVASFLVLGVVVGSLATTLAGSADPAIRRMLHDFGGGNGSFIELYLATEIAFCALIAAGAGIAVTSHLAAEERAHRLDPLLALPLGRRRLLTPYLLAGFALPAALLLLFGTSAWVADRATGTGTGLELTPLVRSAVATFPAVFAVVAVSVLLFGIHQRWVAFGWAVLILAGTVGQFGAVLSLPAWARDWSPFEHLPAYPADHVDLVRLGLLAAAAVLVTAAGSWAFIRRQID